MRMMWIMAGLMLAVTGSAAPDLSPELRAAMEGAVERQDIRAAVVGLYGGGETAVYGFGRIGGEDGRTPTGDTAFEIGSITKVFTVLLAQAQVDAGRLDWDTTLTSRLPDIVFESEAVAAITLRELASHTSGLPRIPENLAPDDPFDPYAGYGRDDLLSWLAAFRPKE